MFDFHTNRMNKIGKILFAMSLTIVGSGAYAQHTLDDSGINAGFFDSSFDKDINFSDFHLPPLAVLFENAKSNPEILRMAKLQEIAQAEVTKQKKHIFSYVYGHASYSYGKTDMWGNGSSTYSTMIYQFQGSEQNYWNVGVNVSVPLEDVLDLSHSVKRKRLLVEEAQFQKDKAYDELKLEIVTLYVRITNNLAALRSAGVNAAIYQGAGELNEVEFHQGNMEIEDYAYTGLRGQSAVNNYQGLLTQITTDIVTLEILSHTPILTNTTTEITLESGIEKSRKEIAKENKAMEKHIKKVVEEQRAKEVEVIKAEREKEKQEQKQAEKDAKQAEKDAKQAAKNKKK